MAVKHTPYPREREEVIELLKSRDIIPTSQRVEIAGILMARPQHLSADQILQRALEKGTYISKATIYNTLNLFTAKGLAREVIVDSGKVFFDSNTDGHNHFYNEDTGELIDFEPDRMKITELPSLPENTVTSGVDVVIRIRNKA
ncbi:MAG: Fur family transcriptional regulator [Gammaproteobacteria bacterium]|nr:Fur family transcriptional regulator [Gammaproteobacteria bacterium]